jgi:hypothetical protein
MTTEGNKMKRMSTPLACALGALGFAGASSAWATACRKAWS